MSTEEELGTTSTSGTSSEFPRLTNRNIITVLRGNRPDHVPVWIMRQAGRYLPEFREIRQTYDFLTLIRTPELACKVTLMPIQRYHFDAAIIFSDILVVPEAMGMKLVMEPGPVFPEPITIENFKEVLKVEGAAEKLKYVGEALTLARHALNGEALLYGFAGAPWTLMCYMIEGKSSNTYGKARQWLYAYPIESSRLITMLTNVIVDYCVMQALHGAQIIQIFDTNAGYLPKDLYFQFFLYSLRVIRREVKNRLSEMKHDPVPMVIFAKGAYYALEEFAKMDYEIIGLDYSTTPEFASSLCRGRNVIFQGNLDPCALYASPEDVKKMTYDMLSKFEGTRLIANLGHGILPDTPLESVRAFVDAIRAYNKKRSTLKTDYQYDI